MYIFSKKPKFSFQQPEPVYQFGERNKVNIATMIMTVNLVSCVWDQVQKGPVRHPLPEIKYLVR